MTLFLLIILLLQSPHNNASNRRQRLVGKSHMLKINAAATIFSLVFVFNHTLWRHKTRVLYWSGI